MSAVGVTENVKGDMRKFEIWYSGREVVYVVQVFHPPLLILPCCRAPLPGSSSTHTLCLCCCALALLSRLPRWRSKWPG